jgi:hypothetical protein
MVYRGDDGAATAADGKAQPGSTSRTVASAAASQPPPHFCARASLTAASTAATAATPPADAGFSSTAAALSVGRSSAQLSVRASTTTICGPAPLAAATDSQTLPPLTGSACRVAASGTNSRCVFCRVWVLSLTVACCVSLTWIIVRVVAGSSLASLWVTDDERKVGGRTATLHCNPAS